MVSESIGIIFPPPELRNIVDKTASFVARNGPEFESRIQQNEQNNPKFNFLKNGDPYNGYYKHKVTEFREGAAKPNEISAPPSTAASQVTQQQQNQSALKSAKQLESLAETPIIIREPPPDFEFCSEPPSLSAVDLDIVKLTAQFVAINGRSFLTNLMSREQRNYQFDFLRPQHGLFSYFTQLIEQYNKIWMPPKSIADDLRKEVSSQKNILDKVRYRLQWTKIQEAERRREEEEAERERVQYAQIDWHDFVMVETVDYQPHEQGMFPPPTTPEQVGSRIILQARIEQEQVTASDDMDMDLDDDDNSKREEKAKVIMPAPVALPPLPPSLDNVLIRKDYDPKAKNQVQSIGPKDAWVVSPITGEKVPADKLQEHMRYALLDPRWVEERERSINEKINKEEVFAPGTSIESSLKNLAERRTDIFGSGDVETEIGRKIGEEERHRKQDKVTWDGFSSTAESTRAAARASITVEEQLQHIQQVHNMNQEKNRIGPAPTHNALPPMHHSRGGMPNMMNSMPNHQHQGYQQGNMGHGMMLNQGGNQMMMGNSGGFMLPTPPIVMPQGMYGMMPPNMQMPVPSFQPEEPVAKKQKTEDTLIPEQDYIAANAGSVTIQVIVPHMPDKQEWNMNGQALSLTLDLTDNLNVVKTKIFEQIGLPQGKQKLQYEGMFVKDSNTLAFYNVPNAAQFILGLKERGGRKK
ncbi:Splicing factor 3A subunit 1 [Halotydeus destructor]|nr:Splicing factor 3A subunit 1 [Halotydeus destructor]